MRRPLKGSPGLQAGEEVTPTVVNMRRQHKQLAQKDAGSTSLTLELADGWRWVRLETVAALDAEEQAMGGCVSSGVSDNIAATKASDGVYSLRDARGKTHVAVEVIGGDVRKTLGQGNTTPTGYASSLGALVHALGVGIGNERPGLFGLASIDGVLMPVDEALARLAVDGVVDGDVDFHSCCSLTSLPEGLVVGGHLYLNGCTSLTSLPEGLVVGKSLALDGCSSLTCLPEGLRVGWSLYLFGCTSLTSLPEGLEVGGSLYIVGNTSLTSLPEGLEVGGDLELSGGALLESLPEELKVGGRICGADHLLWKPSIIRDPTLG